MVDGSAGGARDDEQPSDGQEGHERVALLFPGQGAQYPGMGRAAFQASAAARAVFARADAALAYPLSRLCFEGGDDDLRQTRYQQPAILTCSLAGLAAHQERDGIRTVGCATGHSLGLYSALTAAGSLTLDDAVRLVALRGELMQRASDAVAGGMAAVLGLDDDVVEQTCAEVSRGDDVVGAANYNAPGQVVISGTEVALERAMNLLMTRGARKVVRLPVAGAFHSPLMRLAAEQMAPALDSVAIGDASYPIITNSTAQTVSDAEAIRGELIGQILAPVRWTVAVRRISAMGIGTFVDCGPGSTIAGLLKRIVPGAPVVRLDT